MKKIKYIFYIIPLALIFLFVGCKTEELKVSSKITSVTCTEGSIEFYETTTSNLEITAKAVLECSGSVIEEIGNITVNQTTKYSFLGLTADTEYQINIYYKYDTNSYVKLTTETVKTKEPSTVDITIACEDESFVYDGKPKTLSASIDGGYNLEYTYYLNGDKVDSAINVGEYKVVISFAGNESYNPTTIERKLTITPCKVDIPLEVFNVNYNEEYNIAPDLKVDYEVIYYQNDVKLSEKPTLPGTYSVMIQVTDPNYSGSKMVEFTINKLEYSLDYEDIFVLVGTPVTFEVEEFVKVEYFLNNAKVNEISGIGEYEVKFSFENHPIYKDFTRKIRVIVDNKYRISIDANDVVVETGLEYTPTYTTNYGVELDVTYYLDDIEIEKPVQVGIYKIRLSYTEDETYHSVEKMIDLYIYPEEQEIIDLTNGLYHIIGTVVGKDKTYSYVVNGEDVLFVSDPTLEPNVKYDLVGIFDNTGTITCASVLKKTKLEVNEVQAKEVSLIDFESHLDSYLYKYISLKGMVILKEGKYALALEDNFSILVDNRFKSAYENQTAVSVNMIFYGDTHIIADFSSAVLSDKEKVYAQALIYTFEDIKDTLVMETTVPFETSISYVSSSNPSVIDVTTEKVTPSKSSDVTVDLTVRFTIGTTYCEKTVTVKVLKEEIAELKIYSIEMHQQYGDSTLITYGDYDILIDAGDQKDGPYVNQFLKEHISSDNHLDMIIVTHCHSDHMGGLAKISSSDRMTKALDGIDTIGTIIDYGHDRNTNALHNNWVSLRQTYINKGAEYYPVYDAAKNLNGAKSHHQIDSKLSIDFLDTDTYAMPLENKNDSLNIYSIATLLTFENFKFFFAGDLEDKGESNLLKNATNTPIKDIKDDNVVLYKAAHHGTDPGNNNGGTNGGNQLPFLKVLKPDYFFVSAAMCSGDYPYPSGTSSDNKIKFIGGQPHPYIKCLVNFLKFNDNVYYNGTNGTLEFITDGEIIKSIHGYGATTNYLLEANSSPIDYASQADLKLIDTLWYKKNRKEAVDKLL
ncbi:MAG: MBG domain-containing protein [Anaeroplasmataceae bacterium]|nr:MBG domain-containing protein [Anaeroplasmataceae bacterium]